LTIAHKRAMKALEKGGESMDYRRLYTMLFNSITDAIELLEKLAVKAARDLLVAVQQKAEDEYIETE